MYYELKFDNFGVLYSILLKHFSLNDYLNEKDLISDFSLFKINYKYLQLKSKYCNSKFPIAIISPCIG